MESEDNSTKQSDCFLLSAVVLNAEKSTKLLFKQTLRLLLYRPVWSMLSGAFGFYNWTDNRTSAFYFSVVEVFTSQTSVKTRVLQVKQETRVAVIPV